MSISRWRDWNVTLHWPRALIFYMWIISGTFLSPSVDYLLLVLSIVAAFGYLQLTAYALDELKGRHCDTNFSNRELVERAFTGSVIAVIVGFTILFLVTSSYIIAVMIMIGAIFVVAYNYEVLGAHSRIVFSIVWGAFPVLAHYILHTMQIPPVRVWVFALFVAVFSYMHIISYGNYMCLVKRCRDKETTKDCHGQACMVRTTMVYKPIHHLQKKITGLQTWLVVLIAMFIVVIYYGC